jgi:hypothetical protein
MVSRKGKAREMEVSGCQGLREGLEVTKKRVFRTMKPLCDTVQH